MTTTEHLNPGTWAVANRALVRKAIAEFTHERILEPVAIGNVYELASGSSRYTFSARLYPLNHWEVDGASITRERDGRDAPVDALDFITEFHQQLGIGAEMLPVYLEEISSTLASAAYKLSKPEQTAVDLVTADFQAIEAAMTEGHPCFVANNGRLGFGISDYRAFAPETGQPVRLAWIAVHRSPDDVLLTAHGLTYDDLLRTDLGDDQLRRFAERIVAAGADPDEYVLHAGAPVAVGEQALDHVRGRHRPAAHHPPRRRRRRATRRSSPSARSSTPVAPGAALRQDGDVGAEHGLHARPLADST